MDAIAANLQELGTRLIIRAFGELGSQDALPLTHLRDIAEQYFSEEWREDPRIALEVMLKRTITRLEGNFGDITRQEAALRLFNLDGAPRFPEVKKLSINYIDGEKKPTEKRFDYLRRKLIAKAKFFPPESSSVRREITKLRRTLAEVLDSEFPLVSESEQQDASSSAVNNNGNLPAYIDGARVVRPVVADAFISRPEYEETIRALRGGDVRHIWLYGDAGTGKSRLARAANRDIIEEKAVPVLSAGNNQRLEQQVSSMLIKYDISPEAINPTNLWALFISLLRGGRLPKVIVFDEMPDDPVLDLLMTNTESTLVFTSIERPPSRYEGYSLEVREMNDTEASAMIRSRLPEISEPDLRLLIGILGGRPLALEHSCAYLRETGIPIADYCAAINQQPALTLEAAGSRYGRTLTRVYELTLEKLNDAFDSLRALDYLVFTLPTSMTAKMMLEMWADSLTIPGSESPAKMFSENSSDFISFLHMLHSPGVAHVSSATFVYVAPTSIVSLHAAIRRLEDFGLVRSENGKLVIHQLTRSILRALRANRAEVVYERIRATVYELLRIDGWQLGEAVPLARALWGIQVMPTLASLDATALDSRDRMTDTEINRLTTLLALAFRSGRQMGFPIDDFVGTVKQLLVTIILRATYGGYEEKSRATVFNTFTGLYKELIGYHVGKLAFDISQDGKLISDGDPSPYLISLAFSARLQNDTEWQLPHHLANTTGWLTQTASLNSPLNLINNATVDVINPKCQQYKTFAKSSIQAASIHYYACHWNDAIGALEHAYSCYMKVGADAECTKGVIDTARRLARVHLRAGRLSDAALWLIRAQWIFQVRSEARPNGMPLRYQLLDLFLEIQLNQIITQLELTNEINRFEEDDSDEAVQKLNNFINNPHRTGNGQLISQSRLEEAAQAVEFIIRIGERRLVPEAQMHTVRLQMLTGAPIDPTPLIKLSEWFTSEKLSHQIDLLNLQLEILSTPFTAALANFDEREVRDLTEALPKEAREQLLLKLERRRDYTQKFYEAARSMWDKHRNRYWYARGLCACFLIAQTAGHTQDWIDGLRSELENAVIEIGRPDWIEKVYAFGRTNGGFWLFGY